MKRKNILWSMLLIAGIALASCTKNDDTTSTSTTDDVADIIATAVSSDNSGLTEEMTAIVSFSVTTQSSGLKSTSADTVFAHDTTFMWQNQNGATYSYQYTYRAKYGYIYSYSGPDTLFYNADASGNFDGLRLGCTETRQSEWKVTGFEATELQYMLNGSTTRSADSQSKIRNKNQVKSTSTIKLNNVAIDKSTKQVKSGTLDWEISGTVNGESFQYMAQITYQGDGMAQLAMNGKVYTLNLSSGQVE